MESNYPTQDKRNHPLQPIEIVGGPLKLRARVFFDKITRQWTTRHDDDDLVPAKPYSCVITDTYPDVLQAVPISRPSFSPLIAAREVRLLVIHPMCLEANTLRCSLIHVSLDDFPPFTALSYTWGDPSEKRSILLDDVVLEIGKSLYDALRRVQQKEHFEFLWADALVINQEDRTEKNVQVPLMRDIYGQARLTVAWLGGHTDNSELAITELKSLGKAFWELDDESAMLGRSGRPSRAPHQATWNLQLATQNATTEFMTMRTAEERRDAYRSVIQLMCRPYWQRVWTQQEMIIPQYMAFACGDSAYFGTLELISIWQVFLRYGGSGDCLYGKMPQEEALDRAVQLLLLSLEANRHKAQLKYLIYAKDLQATDPRDHVFALLGMAVDAGSLGLEVDYYRTVQAVFTELVSCFVRKGDLDLIACSQFPKKLSGLPSWVPDWTSSLIPNLPGVALDLENHISYAASGNTLTKADTLFDGGTSILRICGVRLGCVEHVGQTWSDRVNDELMVQSLALLDDITHLIDKHWVDSAQEFSEDVSFEVLRSLDPNTSGLHQDGTDETPAELDTNARNSFEALLELRKLRGESISGSPKDQSGLDERILDATARASRYSTSIVRRVIDEDRRIFVTKQGFVGLGPSQVEVDDVVCVMLGAPVPYVIRVLPRGRRFHFIGTAYVRGAMNGEAMTGDVTEESFEIE